MTAPLTPTAPSPRSLPAITLEVPLQLKPRYDSEKPFENSYQNYRDLRNLTPVNSITAYNFANHLSNNLIDRMAPTQHNRWMQITTSVLLASAVGFLNHENGHLNFYENRLPNQVFSENNFLYYLTIIGGGLTNSVITNQHLYRDIPSLTDESTKVYYVTQKFDPLVQGLGSYFPNINFSEAFFRNHDFEELTDPDLLRKRLSRYVTEIVSEQPYDKDCTSSSYGYSLRTARLGLAYHFLDPVFLLSLHGIVFQQDHEKRLTQLPQFYFLETAYGPLFHAEQQFHVKNSGYDSPWDEVSFHVNGGVFANDGTNRDVGFLLGAGIYNFKIPTPQPTFLDINFQKVLTPEQDQVTMIETEVSIPTPRGLYFTTGVKYKPYEGFLPDAPFHASTTLNFGISSSR